MEGSHNLLRPSAEAKREILDQLTATEGFERFLHVKFPGTKRFGLDGGESTVPALEAIIRRSAELGVDEIVIGMSHRGRLNVLANVMGKPYTAIFSEFQGGCGDRRRAGLGRRQVPPRHLDRSRAARRPQDPPQPDRQPVASGGGQPGGAGQGARQADGRRATPSARA